MPPVVKQLAAVALGAVAHTSLTNCGSDGDHFNIQKIEISPDPPQRGQPITVTLEGAFDKDIATARVETDLFVSALNMFSMPVKYSSTFSTSPVLMRKGDHQVTIGPLQLPRYVPGTMEVNGTVKVADAANEPVLCVDLSLNVPAAEDRSVELSAPLAGTCGHHTDHLKHVSVGLGSVSGELDEDVTKAQVNVDIKIHAGWVPIEFKMPVPISYSPGFPAGAFNLTGSVESQSVLSQAQEASEPVNIDGQIQMSDGAGEELFCYTVAAATPHNVVV
jgi:hypothetical protein